MVSIQKSGEKCGEEKMGEKNFSSGLSGGNAEVSGMGDGNSY